MMNNNINEIVENINELNILLQNASKELKNKKEYSMKERCQLAKYCEGLSDEIMKQSKLLLTITKELAKAKPELNQSVKELSDGIKEMKKHKIKLNLLKIIIDPVIFILNIL